MYLGLDTVQQASPRAMLQRLVRRSRADQTGPPWGIVVLPTFQELKLSPPGPHSSRWVRRAPCSVHRAAPGETGGLHL